MELQSEWTMPVITRHPKTKVEYPFNPGQIKEVPDDFPVKNVRHFKVVKEGTLKKKKEKKEEVNLDLNRDGKVDEKDASIAGKVMASRRHKK